MPVFIKSDFNQLFTIVGHLNTSSSVHSVEFCSICEVALSLLDTLIGDVTYLLI